MALHAEVQAAMIQAKADIDAAAGDLAAAIAAEEYDQISQLAEDLALAITKRKTGRAAIRKGIRDIIPAP